MRLVQPSWQVLLHHLHSFERIYDLNRRYRFKAFLPISIGCNNYCSYCIVPYVRGRERSVEPEKIINSIEELVADGMIEVMLLGQNVNSYGSDFKTTNKNYDFSRLLDDVAMIGGLKRIRFMTSHPKDFKKNIVDAIKRNENIMHHIHLPLQAGSDKILRLMNRKYTRDEYIGVYRYIKERIPDCAVTTDIIVGFPGESERDFEQTLDIVERLRFNRAFTFIYSPRNGTEAADLYKNNCVSIPEKQVRFDRLLNLQNAISLEENRKFLGKKVRVLVEGKSKRKAGQFEGRLDNNLIVNFESKKDLAGRLVNIKVVEATPFYLIGEDPGNAS